MTRYSEFRNIIFFVNQIWEKFIPELRFPGFFPPLIVMYPNDTTEHIPIRKPY